MASRTSNGLQSTSSVKIVIEQPIREATALAGLRDLRRGQPRPPNEAVRSTVIPSLDNVSTSAQAPGRTSMKRQRETQVLGGAQSELAPTEAAVPKSQSQDGLSRRKRYRVRAEEEKAERQRMLREAGEPMNLGGISSEGGRTGGKSMDALCRECGKRIDASTARVSDILNLVFAPPIRVELTRHRRAHPFYSALEQVHLVLGV